MATPEASQQHYARQQRLTAAALTAARSSWSQMTAGDLDRSFLRVGPRLLALTVAIQRAAVSDAIAYVPSVLDEQGITIAPAGRTTLVPFVGVASDGRPLETLLYEPVIRAKQLIGERAGTERALQGGLASLERIIATQVADAARDAVGVGIAARPRIGWVRMLEAPSCSRCVVLAGKFFKWNSGFLRHPRCDCRHIPTTENLAGDLTTDPRRAIEAGQVTDLSRADHRAIVEDGADVNQVVNARRKGMTTSLGTAEGTTRRGGPRMRPEQIYRTARNDREVAVELLRRHGYLT